MCMWPHGQTEGPQVCSLRISVRFFLCSHTESVYSDFSFVAYCSGFAVANDTTGTIASGVNYLPNMNCQFLIGSSSSLSVSLYFSSISLGSGDYVRDLLSFVLFVLHGDGKLLYLHAFCRFKFMMEQTLRVRYCGRLLAAILLASCPPAGSSMWSLCQTALVRAPVLQAFTHCILAVCLWKPIYILL